VQAERNSNVDSKVLILVVDDDPVNREIMEEILESVYQVATAENGEQAIEKARQLQPKAVLLDINMPGMSGYQVCETLKNDNATRHIPITFVSALDTLGERLTGYEAGGDDYITKPFEAKELLSKLKVMLSNSARQDQLSNSTKEAINTAKVAMTSTSELGVVVNFLRESFSCSDLEQLAQITVDALSNFGLRSTVQIRANGEIINRTSDAANNPLETTVISRIYKEKRILEIGQRIVFNYEHVSILCKGLPWTDPDKVGRFRDHIALLAEGCEERVKSILAQMELKAKQYGLVKMVASTRSAMENVGQTHEEHKVKSIGILGDLIVDVESSFSVLGLSEEQKESFMAMINRAIQATIALYNDGLDIDERLQAVLEDVQDIMDNGR